MRTVSGHESVSVAYVKKAHALEGELFVQLETDYPFDVFVEGRVFRVSDGGPIGLAADLTLVRGRPHAGGWILEFREIEDRTLAERYRGHHLSLPREELVALRENEFFQHDLEGLEVVGPSGERLGEVDHVYGTDGPSLLAVDAGDGREHLVPFVAEIVEEVDLEAATIRVRPPAGLLEL